MIQLLFFLLLALGFSFVCSILEAVLLSTNQSFLLTKAEGGNKAALKLLSFKQNIDRPLSAILSLNTVAHTVGAAGVGAKATEEFGEVYFGAVSAILTILILVFTEIIPKTLGARYWRQLALIVSPVINVLIFITYPLVKISELITKSISHKHNEQTTSREELSALANIGVEEGVFEESENSIIQNLIKLNSVKLHEIMTHRIDIVALPVEATLEEVVAVVNEEKYSRIPIYEDNIDNIIGVLHSKYLIQYLEDCSTKENFNLKDIILQPFFVPEFRKLEDLFKEIKKNNNHMAIVIDEYGGTSGVVTLEDLIEEILGNIFDEDDELENDIVTVDENTFIINGTTSLDDVMDFVGVELPIEKYETLSGFLIGQLGSIPEKDDDSTIDFNGLIFKVLESDKKIVSKVQVCRA